ncbi:hypothetical protein ACPOL_5207 [Acidisarcina polymorpha]|uniref:Uncharacterized protein n=1 Tax=Acidisarcina polymorpha TaxID=2211140 RepID=A0A2Z5G5U1_9BACT|nr:hypothetical protein ACPOL_5207 [Acidisarcina polymorpha]
MSDAAERALLFGQWRCWEGHGGRKSDRLDDLIVSESVSLWDASKKT